MTAEAEVSTTGDNKAHRCFDNLYVGDEINNNWVQWNSLLSMFKSMKLIVLNCAIMTTKLFLCSCDNVGLWSTVSIL